MKKTITLFIFFFALYSSIFSQTIFDWETASDNGTNVTQTKDGILVTVTSSSSSVDITNGGGLDGSAGNVVFDGTFAATSMTFSFNTTVNITSIYSFTATDSGGSADWVYTPTGISNSIATETIPATSGVNVSLNWIGITSFTVTKLGGGGSTFAFDDLTVTTGTPNSDPTISMNNTVLSYTEGNTATQIDATATVNDADGDADWNGGTLVAQITANAEATDEISIADTDGDGTAITVSGTNILANGIDIGDLSTSGGIVNNNTALTITFDSDATNANVQEVLQSLRYRNTSGAPGTNNRTITVTANDNNGGSANDARTISVISTPIVTSVSVPANSTYISGQNLDFTVNFDENAIVNTTGGTPQLTIIIGSTASLAIYQSGSGTNSLLYRYTIQTGDLDTDGISVVSLDTNGGTIQSGTGTDANLTLNSVGTTSNVLVDGVAPTGYSVSIDQSPINAANDNAISFTFASTEVGATYNYTFSSSGGAGSVTGSGTVATATDQITGIDISGLADGTITLSVTLTDVSGNTGAAATDNDTKETVAPTGYAVTIDQSPINAANDNAISFTFASAEVGATYNYTFSSSEGASTVSGLGVVATATDQITGIDISSLADGTITLSVTLTDVNGNTGTAATDTESKDTLAPTVVITSTINDNPTNANPIPVIITFIQEVTGFVASDITVGNGSVSNFSTSDNIVFTADIIPNVTDPIFGSRNVTVNVSSNVSQDIAGNGNTAATEFSIAYDNIRPIPFITSTSSDPTADSSISFQVEFIERDTTLFENVFGFESGDVTITNGTISNFTGSGNTYTFDITPVSSGLVTVNILENIANDSANNGNESATEFEIAYDGNGPAPVITSSEMSPTDSNVIPIMITFNEEVQNFTATDITITNGSIFMFATTDNMVFTGMINPTMPGQITVNIAQGVATDLLGNDNSAATEFSIVVNGDSISINTPIAGDNIVNGTESSMLLISGTSQGLENASGFNLQIGSVSASVNIGNDGTWSSIVDISGLTNGNYNVTIDGPDSFGSSVGDFIQITLDQQVLSNETFDIETLISVGTVVSSELIINSVINIISIKTYSLQGVLVAKTKNISRLTSGIYISVIETEKGIITKKIIKK